MAHSSDAAALSIITRDLTEQAEASPGSLFRKKRFHNHLAPQPMTMMGLARLCGRYLFASPAVPAPIRPLPIAYSGEVEQ